MHQDYEASVDIRMTQPSEETTRASGSQSLGRARSTAYNQNRHVRFCHEDKNLCDNRVITSHYTVLNFVPKNLLEQFSKPANMYFLFLMCLQTIPEVTVTGQIPTIALPLVTVIFMNALKD
eukprot:g30239.t1